jgi:hypothetical protein
VLEYQKRGAVHFHLAVRGFMSVNILRHHWKNAITSNGSRLNGIDAPGNIDMEYKKGRPASRGQISRYLAKYMGKALECQDMNAKRYSASTQIKRPEHRRFYISSGDSPDLQIMRLIELVSGKPLKYTFEPIKHQLVIFSTA